MLAAQRALVVDVMRRITERETDRARRHQATPQKLRAWVETFYATHEHAVADALTPAVRMHLSMLGMPSDPEATAWALAQAHVQESRDSLLAVLHVEDFAPEFEKLLQRWERTRPEATADRLLREGVDYVRSYR